MPVPQRQSVVPATATATYTPLTGWTRPPSTTMATAPRTGGVYGADELVSVSSVVKSGIVVPAITAGSNFSDTLKITFPDLPAITPTPSEQPIILVTAFASHALAHLVVSGIDCYGVAFPQGATSSTPTNGPYLPAGLAVATWAAQIALFLQTDGSNFAGGGIKLRVNAQLIIRRLGQPTG